MSNEQIITYQSPNGHPSVDVRLQENILWLSLNQLTDLFKGDKSIVSWHAKNIFKEGKLDRGSVVAFFATTAADNKTCHYV